MVAERIEYYNKLFRGLESGYVLPIKYIAYNKHLHTFDTYLRTLFEPDKVDELCDLYQVGGTLDGRAIFWQIDYLCQCRSGKVIAYGSDGHRIKDGSIQGATWVHSLLEREGKLPDGYHLEQCMFGEHLLHIFPDKPVAVVEAEKTAIICAAIYPEYNWVAVGGKNMFSIDRCKALNLKNVLVFPDTDEDGSTYQLWKQKAAPMKYACRSIKVCDILERCASQEEKAKKIDIADLLLKDYTGSTWTENPPYKDLHDIIMNKPF